MDSTNHQRFLIYFSSSSRRSSLCSGSLLYLDIPSCSLCSIYLVISVTVVITNDVSEIKIAPVVFHRVPSDLAATFGST